MPAGFNDVCRRCVCVRDAVLQAEIYLFFDASRISPAGHHDDNHTAKPKQQMLIVIFNPSHIRAVRGDRMRQSDRRERNYRILLVDAPRHEVPNSARPPPTDNSETVAIWTGEIDDGLILHLHHTPRAPTGQIDNNPDIISDRRRFCLQHRRASISLSRFRHRNKLCTHHRKDQ